MKSRNKNPGTMNTESFAKTLKRLITIHDRVAIPGLGSFISEHLPASAGKDGCTLLPPRRKIAFIRNETWNDGLLEHEYAKTNSITEEKASNEIEQFVSELKTALENSGSYEIPGIGRIETDMADNISFVEHEDADMSSDSFGLPEIRLKDETASAENPSSCKEATMENPKEKEDTHGEKDSASTMPEPVRQDTENEKGGIPGRIGTRQRKILIIAAICLAAILLAVLLLKNDISMMLENIFYTDEELELIRKYH